MQTSILFVDDEPDLEVLIRQKFRKELRERTMALEFASHGVEALAKIDGRDDEFDLIVTDINMPQMDGLELLLQLGRRELVAPVVVLSAYGDMANIRTAMNRGAFDFLTKPIDFQDLTITRDKALRHAASQRERARLERDKLRIEKRAAFVREAFGRYLSDSVVQALLDAPDGLRLGGEKRELSVLMSDLRRFTPMCEQLPPDRIVAVLNGYFGVMTEVVMEHGGTIDELLGDAMLVIFGAPLPQSDHADRAVACALAMQRAMAEVNRDNAAQGLPRLEMGIAINTGEGVVGNIGSAKRSKYGVVGSIINLTARIEGLTSGGQVLVSDATLAATTRPVAVEHSMMVEVKGFSEPVRVHRLAGGPASARGEGAATTTASQVPPVESPTVSRPRIPTPVAPPEPEPDTVQAHLATIGLMIAGVAHDIRNPLSFILSFADLTRELTDEISGELLPGIEGDVAEAIESVLVDARTNLGKITEHGARANELVRTMVETLRGTRAPAQRIDLNVSVLRHLELFESSMRATEPGLELVLRRDLDDAAGGVTIAPQDISRILLNLVSNACDAARAEDPARRDGEPATVVVSTRDRGDRVELRVRDNGTGIPESIRDAIFDPFFTTKAVGTEVGHGQGGMGLGLAFIRQLVESLGGTIEVQTEEHRFTEFVVSLPRDGAKPTPT